MRHSRPHLGVHLVLEQVVHEESLHCVRVLQDGGAEASLPGDDRHFAGVYVFLGDDQQAGDDLISDRSAPLLLVSIEGELLFVLWQEGGESPQFVHDTDVPLLGGKGAGEEGAGLTPEEGGHEEAHCSQEGHQERHDDESHPTHVGQVLAARDNEHFTHGLSP